MTVVSISDRQDRLNKEQQLTNLISETESVERMIAALKKIERYLFSINGEPELISETVRLKARKRFLINKQIRLGV